MGNFCYGCGKLGHERRHCIDAEVEQLVKEGMDLEIFGRWLRANNAEFQPGINKQWLLEVDKAACSSRDNLQTQVIGDNSGEGLRPLQQEQKEDNS